MSAKQRQTKTYVGFHTKSLRAPITWGFVVGAIMAAVPFAFWWLDPALVYSIVWFWLLGVLGTFPTVFQAFAAE